MPLDELTQIVGIEPHLFSRQVDGGQFPSISKSYDLPRGETEKSGRFRFVE
jgi:hypothetical protein